MTTFVNFKLLHRKRPGVVGIGLMRAPVVVVKAGQGAGQGAGSGGGGAVALPVAWLAVALPAGFIGPLLGQLAMARGESAAYSTAGKTLSIGGRVLIGTAGKVFEFKTQGAADMWLLVNANKVQKELQALAGLPPASLAVWKAAKVLKMAARAVTITANAARMADADKRAALAAEAGFYTTKWS